jgi:hypothetical protein
MERSRSVSLFFEWVRNVKSQKAVTVGEGNLLRQFPFDQKNMRQHWQRLHQHHPSDGTFKFVNRATNLVIDAIGGQLADGVNLQIHEDTGNPNQRWRIVPRPQNPDVFFIKAAGTDKAWDVPNGSVDDGTVIQLYTLHEGQNQRWRLEHAVAIDNVFFIQSIASGLVLDVPGFSQEDGASLQQYDSNNGFNQMWERIDLPNGTSKIRSVCSGKLLDYPLAAAQQNQQAFVTQYEDNGGDNQRWTVNVVGHDTAGNAIVSIGSALNGFVLDVQNSSGESGVLIQAYPHHGGTNQRWRLLSAA